MTPQELAELDLAVARAEGIADARLGFNLEVCEVGRGTSRRVYQPTRDGAEAMRLLEKWRFTLFPADTQWGCSTGERGTFYGPTPAIAICRAVVELSKT